MKNTSKILLNKITDETVISILRSIVPILNEFQVEYFIVGAFARDIQLFEKGHTAPPARKTKDIDLAVMVASHQEFDNIKERISQIDGFVADPKEPYRFVFKESYEVDLLPFGEIENEKGQVELKAQQTIVLDMPGFKVVFPKAEAIETVEGIRLQVSSLSGVVLLKILAWEDRKDRRKDIEDIDYILDHFYFIHAEEIADQAGDLFDLYQEEHFYFDQNVAARYIGRQIGTLLLDTKELFDRVASVLRRESNDLYQSQMGRIMDKRSLEDAVRIIRQLVLGMEDVLA